MMVASIVVLNVKVDDTLAGTQRIAGLSFPEGPAEGGNYLIIGSDTRAFVSDAQQAQAFGSAAQEGGQRSDTMMVLHVDPERKSNLLVSFPRDLLVNIPGEGRGQINAAFNSGPQKVIDLMKEDFDLDINHYVEIDFQAFIGVVDAGSGRSRCTSRTRRATTTPASTCRSPDASRSTATPHWRTCGPPPGVPEERTLVRRQPGADLDRMAPPAGLHPQAGVLRVGEGGPEPARRASRSPTRSCPS